MRQNINKATDINTLLWEITGNGSVGPSFVVGTFHCMCKRDFQIKPKVICALDQVQKVVLEIDYTNPEEIEEMQGMFRSDKKLSKQLAIEEFNDLNEVLKTYGTTSSEVDDYSILALYMFVVTKAIRCPEEEVCIYEEELLKEAMKRGIAIGGLEKVTDQIEILKKAYDLKEIVAQLKLSKAFEGMVRKMVQAFNDENIDELDKLVRDRRFMNERQEKWLLTDRNEKWVNRLMPEMMEKERVMFAVGAGHLSGENGIIELLRRRGYDVKPVL